jgi:hypothetical protein|tara:strand:- start:3497 stop:3694 length:198 start_codon:yes stop_codon:yes gene_type:complete
MFWGNLIVLLLWAGESTGVVDVVPDGENVDEITLIIVTLVNIILRKRTDQPVTFSLPKFGLPKSD